MATTIGNSVSNTSNATSGSTSSGSTSTSSSGTSGTVSSNYATNPSTGTLSSAGIGSGLNVSSLVSQLMGVAQGPVNLISSKISSYQSELSAYGQMSAAVYTFQTALGGLTSSSAFQATAGTPSNTSVLSAATDNTAVAGNYSISVGQLAQSETLVAKGQASSTTAIGTGASTSITFSFGKISGGASNGGTYSGATFTADASRTGGTITIGASNNSLQGIVAAINAAKVGVTASIVNDGSGTPYRLSLSSSSTGAGGAMKISVSGDASLQSLLNHDPSATQNLSETQAAQDANLSVNGLAIISSSNTVKQALGGTTLTLTGTGSTSLAIGQDTKTISANVQAFVDAYNTLDSSIAQLTDSGTSGGAVGALAGQYNVLQVQAQLRQAFGRPMVDASGKQATLADIGITFRKDGTLALDDTKLGSVLQSNPAQVGALFAQNGVASDSLVSFVGAKSSTVPGTYSLNIASLATQGSLVGSAQAATTVTAGVNDALTVVVDGNSANVTIPAGSYTADTLAAAVQAAVNGASALNTAGSSVTVSQSGGVLTMASSLYGSKSLISIAGSAASGLFGGAPVGSIGKDISGTINGIAATGNGQLLTGLSGSAIDGLKVKVVGGTTGSRGTIGLSQGFANVLNSLAIGFNNPGGLITSATDAINADIKDSQTQVQRMNQQLSLLQAQYTSEFSKLDTILSSLNATQSYLTGQFTSLANTTAYIYGGTTRSG
jgi:flagellar hook-associated protein 2